MTQDFAKMTNFREFWLPQFLEDFQMLQTNEKEETIKALVSALGPSEKGLLQNILPDMLFRDFITELPVEILESVLDFLSFEDLINCCLVCKCWNSNLTSMSAIWKNQSFKQGQELHPRLDLQCAHKIPPP